MNFVAMPRKAVTHIQKRAPGPPQWIAIATPAMFPIPTVAESAVVRAWKWVTSPGSSGSSYFPLVTATPWMKCRIWTKPSRRVRKTPTPRRQRTTKGICSSPTEKPRSHTISLRVFTNRSKRSIPFPLSWRAVAGDEPESRSSAPGRPPPHGTIG